MKWILSWFGLWEWIGATYLVGQEEIEMSVWYRPWDTKTKGNFKNICKLLEENGYSRTYNPDH